MSTITSPFALPHASGRHVLILLCAIVGIVGFCPLSPVAWLMAVRELETIKTRGGSPAAQRFVLAGMILGVIGTVFLVMSLAWVLFFFALSLLSGGR